jgi:hypothetical protein
MNAHIHWNTLPLALWQEKYGKIRRATLLQSYAYARAMASVQHQKPRWGLIEIDGLEAGMVQIMEAGFFKNALHVWTLDQGPLWFEGFGRDDHFKTALSLLRAEFPKRIGRRCRIIPAQPASASIDEILKTQGFHPASRERYQTVWLDLEKQEQDLHADLKKNWRGALQKAERSGLTIEWDEKGQHLGWFLGGYAVDKSIKGYHGARPKLLKALALNFAASGDLIIGRAMSKGESLAGIMILKHGRCATYQAGWTTPQGRETCAHNLLLWQAMMSLKNKGVRDFDLGGINDTDAKGVQDFKTGMGGEILTYTGLYT